jgi:hypothetical protein
LAKSARTVTARVAGSMRASTTDTLEGAARPGHAGGADLVADAQAGQLGLGTWKSTCMCEMSSSVAMVVGVTSEPGLTWRMPTTPANGAHPTVADVRLHLPHARLGRVALGLERVQRGAGDQLLFGSSRWRTYSASASPNSACACAARPAGHCRAG